MTTFVSSMTQGLKGETGVPGDKSISHRALILAALAAGTSRITGLLQAEDILKTMQALESLGVAFEKTDGVWIVHGVGIGGLRAPSTSLDFGNSGTGARLMMGVLATHNMTATVTGDESLSTRPMNRVMEPLGEFGALFDAGTGNTLPIKVTGCPDPLPIHYKLPIASAQVKSAIFLAALNTPGVTTVIEPKPTRDHTERLLGLFGAEVKKGDKGRIKMPGQPELAPQAIEIPGDFSAAAFFIVAASIVPGSEILIRNTGVNPLRTGLLTVLKKMRCKIKSGNPKTASGEPVADIFVGSASLKGAAFGPEVAPLMIDEYPIAFVAAAVAKGATGFSGLEELKHKESNRLQAMAEGLRANGIKVEEGADSIIIHGTDGPVPGGGHIDARHDHRIAMAFLVLGLVAKDPITVSGAESIATSFPGFVQGMNALQANIREQA